MLTMDIWKHNEFWFLIFGIILSLCLVVIIAFAFKYKKSQKRLKEMYVMNDRMHRQTTMTPTHHKQTGDDEVEMEEMKEAESSTEDMYKNDDHETRGNMDDEDIEGETAGYGDI